MNLDSQYEYIMASKKKPFDKEGIIAELTNTPLDIDIKKINLTPTEVVVNMTKKEYMEKKVGAAIFHKFDILPICKEHMIIFTSPVNIEN